MKRRVVTLLLVICFSFISSTLFANTNDTTAITPVTIEELQELEAGTYPVKIEYVDADTNEVVIKIVYMTVYYPKTVTNIEYGEGIDAMDVLVSNDFVLHASKHELIDKASAKAWNLATGESVVITEVIVDYVGASDEYKTYHVTFRTQLGTENKVVFLELPQDDIIPQKEVYISDAALITSQFTNWIYVGVIVFVLLPTILISLSFIRMVKMVKKTKTLLVKEYSERE